MKETYRKTRLRRLTARLARTAFLPLLLLTGACASGGDNTFRSLNHLAVDSVNDRLFITQPEGELFVSTASTGTALAEVPLVDEDTNEGVSELMPAVVTHLAVYPTGSTSRIFLLGALAADDGSLVLNRVRVLDFDGSSFTEPDFSPIELTDNDTATDESDDSFADMLVDADAGRLYASDATAGAVLSADAGTGGTLTQISAPGIPQGLSLDGGRLYVCNASDNDTLQVVSVANLGDGTTTAMDIGVPCSRIAVDSNASGTVLFAKRYGRQEILIHRVDTATYAASTAVASATSGVADGLLASGAGISSGVNDIVTGITSAGVLYAYLSEEDGNIELISLASDLATYSFSTLSVAAENISAGDVYAPSGAAATVYFVSPSGYLVSIPFGGLAADLEN